VTQYAFKFKFQTKYVHACRATSSTLHQMADVKGLNDQAFSLLKWLEISQLPQLTTNIFRARHIER